MSYSSCSTSSLASALANNDCNSKTTTSVSRNYYYCFGAKTRRISGANHYHRNGPWKQRTAYWLRRKRSVGWLFKSNDICITQLSLRSIISSWKDDCGSARLPEGHNCWESHILERNCTAFNYVNNRNISLDRTPSRTGSFCKGRCIFASEKNLHRSRKSDC